MSDFNETWIFQQSLEKVSHIKFHQNPSSGSRVVACGKTDMELMVTIRNFASEPKNEDMLNSSVIHEFILRFVIWCINMF